MDKILAKEFVGSVGGRIINKAQALSEIKNNPAKLETGAFHNLVALVFKDTGIVRGGYTVKSATNGKDSSIKGEFTEVFAKRDGRWQCVTDYETRLQ